MNDFKQVLTETGYSRQEELIFWDCGPDQRVRVAALLSKAAAFAGYDYDARGLTHEVLGAKGEVFLLSRVAVRIHDCPRAGDVLTISTWENGAKGAHMRRVYEIRDAAERLRVSMKSEWILVDPVTRKILRPSSFTARPLTTCDREIDSPDPQKIVLPHEGTEDLGTRVIRWSDLDGNGHLYSGNYGDIVWDALPADLQSRTPREFQINYSKEVTLGDELRLLGFQEGRPTRMGGRAPEAPCFTALCVF